MAGTPTETELQNQWRKAVDLLEKTRAYIDDTVANPGGLLESLEAVVEGEYTPQALVDAAARYRAQMSNLLDPGTALEFLSPIVFEYGQIISAGSGYESQEDLWTAIYEHFVANSLSVKSRGIIFDTSPTAGASNVGNGTVHRLTVDENGFDLEFCHVEKKILRCRADKNTGAREFAESFEILGENATFDAIRRYQFGSGESTRTFLRSHHAGTGAGSSVLRNSSFSTYDATASPKTFDGWTENLTAAVSQDTTNFYRSHPGATVDASLKMTAGAGTVSVTQSLDDMRISQFDSDRPYFFRVMVNKSIGSASGGSVVITLGSQIYAVLLSSLGAGWQEVKLPINKNLWFKNFNKNPITVALAWDSPTSGSLLFDDALLVPWDLVDGTYWLISQNSSSPVSWLVDDTLEVTDTGGAPSTGKIQWWANVAGLGYLPSNKAGSETFTDP